MLISSPHRKHRYHRRTMIRRLRAVSASTIAVRRKRKRVRPMQQLLLCGKSLVLCCHQNSVLFKHLLRIIVRCHSDIMRHYRRGDLMRLMIPRMLYQRHRRSQGLGLRIDWRRSRNRPRFLHRWHGRRNRG